MRPLFLAAAFLAGVGGAAAEGLIGMEKQILPLTKDSWVAFRNYDGRQFVYFTHLVTYRCGLSAIRYSINGDRLDLEFPLPPCDPDNPNALDAEKYPPYIAGPLGDVDSIAIQVVYKDGEESAVLTYAPCADASGDATCATLIE